MFQSANTTAHTHLREHAQSTLSEYEKLAAYSWDPVIELSKAFKAANPARGHLLLNKHTYPSLH